MECSHPLCNEPARVAGQACDACAEGFGPIILLLDRDPRLREAIRRMNARAAVLYERCGMQQPPAAFNLVLGDGR